MITAISEIFCDKIKTLPFVEKISGAVQLLTFEQEGKTYSYPAQRKITLEDCKNGRYLDLFPDSKVKSILFIEDLGSRVIKTDGYKQNWRSSVNIVCWLNLPLLGFDGAYYKPIAIQSILASLPAVPFNDGVFSKIKFNVTGELPMGTDPFEKYNFSQSIMQYLMYPFDSFVLTADFEWELNTKCLTVENLGDIKTCLNK